MVRTKKVFIILCYVYFLKHISKGIPAKCVEKLMKENKIKPYTENRKQVIQIKKKNATSNKTKIIQATIQGSLSCHV